MAYEDDLVGLWSKFELTGTEHLGDFVQDGGLQWLLHLSDWVSLLRVSSSKVVNGEDWIAFLGCVSFDIFRMSLEKVGDIATLQHTQPNRTWQTHLGFQASRTNSSIPKSAPRHQIKEHRY